MGAFVHFLNAASTDLAPSPWCLQNSGRFVTFTRLNSEGFVGNDARGYQPLVAPGGEIAGNSTFCQGINKFAQVVCFVNDSAGNPLGAFIGCPQDEED